MGEASWDILILNERKGFNRTAFYSRQIEILFEFIIKLYCRNQGKKPGRLLILAQNVKDITLK